MTSKIAGILIQGQSGQGSRIRILCTEPHCHITVYREQCILNHVCWVSTVHHRKRDALGHPTVYRTCSTAAISSAFRQLNFSQVPYGSGWGQSLQHEIIHIQLQSDEYEFISSWLDSRIRIHCSKHTVHRRILRWSLDFVCWVSTIACRKAAISAHSTVYGTCTSDCSSSGLGLLSLTHVPSDTGLTTRSSNM